MTVCWRVTRILGLGAFSAALLACGGDEGAPAGVGGTSSGSGSANTAGAGGGAGFGGSAASGNAGLGSSAGNAAGGTASGQGGSSAGAPSGDCGGTFDGADLVVMSAEDALLGSVTLTPDELQLLFTRAVASGPDAFFVAVRPDVQSPFGAPQAVPELDGACGPEDYRSADLSRDGLRAYVVCVEPTGTMGPLRVAERPEPSSKFRVLPTTLGIVGMSPGVDDDELTLFTNDPDFGERGPMAYTRDSVSGAFGSPLPVLGLEFKQRTTPELAPGGQALFFTDDEGLGVAFPNQSGYVPRSAPLVARGTTELIGSPELPASCQRLYYAVRDTQTKQGRIHQRSR